MVTVIGAGFAGVEAAWAVAEAGFPVRLFEMRPVQSTPAHTTGFFAELVCSNSLKSMLPTSPAGLLKEEMAALGSIVLRIAEDHRVPAGEALGVDRNNFGAAITAALENHPNITVERRPVGPQEIAEMTGEVILATGPLTTPDVAEWLASETGRDRLFFFDAVAPTVEASSINLEIAFSQSRYDKGGDDYLNCPLDKETYEAFVHELVHAERAPFHAFEAGGVRGEVEVGEAYKLQTLEDRFTEQVKYFAGCMPIEVIAERGARSLAFGNFKPVGLTDPRTGRRPWAALQLRPENKEKSLYSLVACQTRLKWSEQKRVFRMIPGLENAEFVRYGVIHRNTYLDAPRVLNPDLTLKNRPNIGISGQLTGVEGYVESAAMGIYSGLVAVARLRGESLPVPPRETAYGSLISHLMDATPRDFAPMNINWGLLPDPEPVPRDKAVKRAMKLEAARAAFTSWQASRKA